MADKTHMVRPTGPEETAVNEAAIGKFLSAEPGTFLENAVTELVNDLKRVMMSPDCDGDHRLTILATDSFRTFSIRMPTRPGYEEDDGDHDAHLLRAEADLEAVLATASEAMNAAMTVIRNADPGHPGRDLLMAVADHDGDALGRLRAEVISRERFGVLVSEGGESWPEHDDEFLPWCQRVAREAYACHGADPSTVTISVTDRRTETEVILVPREEGAGAREKERAHSALRQVTRLMSRAAEVPEEIMSIKRHVEQERREKAEHEAAVAAMKADALARIETAGAPDGPGWDRMIGWLRSENALSRRNPALSDQARLYLDASATAYIRRRKTQILRGLCAEIIKAAEKARSGI